MENHFTLCVEPGRAQERLDRFLARSLPDLTRSQLKKLVDGGQVLVDGGAAKAGLRLRGGEQISVTVPPAVATVAVGEDIPLDICYEDSDVIVINKPPGMVVHPACGHSGGTLVNALLHHCDDLSGIGGELRPGIVHRIDKDTSGLLVVSKNDAAHNHLAAQFKEHSINRRYVALVHGLVQNDSGSIDKPIGRHPTQRKKMSAAGRGGRRAVTHWQVLRRYDAERLTLLELRLETGRTHQIRVHFADINLPLVGDPVYGNRGRANAIGDLELRREVHQFQRQALHARLLGFVHPRREEYMEFTCPLPPDMAQLLAHLDRKYAIDSIEEIWSSSEDEID